MAPTWRRYPRLWHRACGEPRPTGTIAAMPSEAITTSAVGPGLKLCSGQIVGQCAEGVDIELFTARLRGSELAAIASLMRARSIPSASAKLFASVFRRYANATQTFRKSATSRGATAGCGLVPRDGWINLAVDRRRAPEGECALNRHFILHGDGGCRTRACQALPRDDRQRL